jgi:hypothetical protein
LRVNNLQEKYLDRQGNSYDMMFWTPSSWANDGCNISNASKKLWQFTAINLLTKTNHLFPTILVPVVAYIHLIATCPPPININTDLASSMPVDFIFLFSKTKPEPQLTY